MVLSEEIEKMVDVIKKYDERLREGNSSYKRYFAPDIPEKVMKELLKNFDSNLAINSVVAFYDTTILGTSKEGLIFTSDGIYYKYLINKPIYFQYKDIKRSYVSRGTVKLKINSLEITDLSLTIPFNGYTAKNVLDELKNVDEVYEQSSFKLTGKVKKKDIPKDMIDKCNVIIHGASVVCGGVGAGLAQVPTSDNAVIVPFQITMIINLGKVFDLNITESIAKSIIASVVASLVGRTVSQVLVGWIPGIGNVINTATAAGITETIGWVAVKNFYARWLEDKNKGRYEGMKDGYIEASREYEKKLLKQAEEFLKQIKDIRREHEEYEHLLKEYEEYIKELERKCAAADVISEIKSIYFNLKNLKSIQEE